MSSSDYFHGKVALVTGASRGVGYATARALVERGARVVMTARGEERLASSRQALADLGGDVVAVAGDVGVWSDAEAMVRAALDRFGRLDVVVNNAGVSMRGRFDELSPEVCERVVRTNLLGCIFPSRAAVDAVVAAKGHIVFISSIAGLFGLPGASIYCATKGALTGLCESLRLELLPSGVHVGVVHLGFTEHDPEKRILAADGSPVLPDRPAHHTQASAADHILRMMERRKKRLVLTAIGHLGAAVHHASPWAVEKAILAAQSSKAGVFKRFS